MPHSRGRRFSWFFPPLAGPFDTKVDLMHHNRISPLMSRDAFGTPRPPREMVPKNACSTPAVALLTSDVYTAAYRRAKVEIEIDRLFNPQFYEQGGVYEQGGGT
jgi:hypothetical protein